MELTTISLLLAGFLTGFSKFSVGGMGLIILPALMIGFSGPEALALLVPIYVLTDVLAVIAYRKGCSWAVVQHIVPLGFVGIGLGAWLLSGVAADNYNYLLGAIVVAMLGLGVWLDWRPSGLLQHPMAAYVTGVMAGFVTLIANAAGPILSLYLIEQKLTKQAYVSTRAWAFLIFNGVKIPVFISLGWLNGSVVQQSAWALPGLLAGACCGYLLLSRLNLLQFKWLIRGMAAIAAVKLFIFS